MLTLTFRSQKINGGGGGGGGGGEQNERKQ